MMLARLKRTLVAPIAFPQYAAVALSDPQDQVSVTLHGLGAARDVTRNHVIAALRPLTIAIALADTDRGAEGPARASLEFRACDGDAPSLGVVGLWRRAVVPFGGHQFHLYEATGSRNGCLGRARMWLYERFESWKAARYQRANPFNFWIPPRDLRALFVLYICPRPVVLVTAGYEGQERTFPMDLIGPTASGWFSLALRTTAASADLITRSRRVALASVSAGYKAVAYELGKYHKLSEAPRLPFATVRSATFGLPVPADALAVREIAIERAEQVGSHTWFLGSIVHETRRGDRSIAPASLAHVQGTYREYRRRRGLPLEDA